MNQRSTFLMGVVLHPKVGWFSNIDYLRVIESLFPSYDPQRLTIHIYCSKILTVATKRIEYCSLSCLRIAMRKVVHTSIKWEARNERWRKGSSWADVLEDLDLQLPKYLFFIPPSCLTMWNHTVSRFWLRRSSGSFRDPYICNSRNILTWSQVWRKPL